MMSTGGKAPLFGLVMAGGRSSRMGRDKASIDYHGVPQAQHAARLLAEVCEKVFVSIRPEQLGDPLFSGMELITDRFPGTGPAGGILSALETDPNAAWLVLGCDLPFVTASTLRLLSSARNPHKLATTYLAAESGLPEPMCTIFEPAFRSRFHELFAENVTCPRKALIRSDVEALSLSDPHALDNVNSPEDFRTARSRLAESGIVAKDAEVRVTIEYYAYLRERTGVDGEMVRTVPVTLAALYDEIASRRRITVPKDTLRVAVNDDLADWARLVSDGDRIVFLTPFGGG